MFKVRKKVFVKTKFCSNKFWVPKTFKSNKNCRSNKLLSPNKFWVKKIKELNIFVQKHFGLKKVRVQKVLGPKELYPKTYVQNIFGPKKIWPKNSVTNKFLV